MKNISSASTSHLSYSFITFHKTLFHSLESNFFFVWVPESLSWLSSVEMTSTNAAQDIAQTATHSSYYIIYGPLGFVLVFSEPDRKFAFKKY